MTGIARVAALVEITLVVVAWGLGRMLGIPVWGAMELSWRAALWGVVATLPLLVGMVWTVRGGWRVLDGLRALVRSRVVPMFARCSLLDLAVISTTAGVGEELFFRGLIQGGLTRVGPAWVGILLASGLFGLAHFVSPLYAFLAGAVGVYLGLLFLGSGNLLVPVVAHALYDAVGLVYLVRFGALETAVAAVPP